MEETPRFPRSKKSRRRQARKRARIIAYANRLDFDVADHPPVIHLRATRQSISFADYQSLQAFLEVYAKEIKQ